MCKVQKLLNHKLGYRFIYTLVFAYRLNKSDTVYQLINFRWALSIGFGDIFAFTLAEKLGMETRNVGKSAGKEHAAHGARLTVKLDPVLRAYGGLLYAPQPLGIRVTPPGTMFEL